MICITTFNIAVQLSAPSWIAGRVLATWQAGMSGGVALGSIIWGGLGNIYGVRIGLIVAAIVLVAATIAVRKMRLKVPEQINQDSDNSDNIETAVPLSGLSGPIIIEVEYNIARSDIAEFYQAMQEVRTLRSRKGALKWELSQNLEEPEYWKEHYRFPTWYDYLRYRALATQAELQVQSAAEHFHQGPVPVKHRHLLNYKARSHDKNLHLISNLNRG